ncbi:MAG: FKBP-type peptidyl-prolyl cis-trans isomerase [Myxococcales bacterium]|nr:FKBP-type peptidyl-prolyl cis-trans isomerase [Myxococcales bacterium]
MQIQPNCVVTVHYTLTEGTADGGVVEATKGDAPLGFILGNGSMIPTFETNLAGLKTGDRFAFAVAAAEAYGEYDEGAIFEAEKPCLPIQMAKYLMPC